MIEKEYQICESCDGTGDCPNHVEEYIDVDITLPCPNCNKGRCSACNGKGFHEVK